MTTYRVGEAGATVFDPEGREIGRLAPGQVVVAGTTDVRGSLARQYEHTAQRRKGYDDKVIRPERGPTS